MRRRRLLEGAAASLTLLATGCTMQPTPTRIVRIGAFTGEAMPRDGTRPQLELDIMDSLRDVGFVRGVNMTIEWRHGESSEFAAFANELIALPVDILIAATATAARAAKAATKTIPIVMEGAGDPMDDGLITSYTHPGGNVTGTAFSNREEAAKRLELLHEALPQMRRVIVLGIGSVSADYKAMTAALTRAAEAAQVDIVLDAVRTDADVTELMRHAAAGDALMSVGSALMFHNTQRLITYANEHGIPTAFSRAADVRAGGLLSYGSNRREIRFGVGAFVRKIVDGAAPGDLPVKTPTLYEKVFNLVVARRLGLTIPVAVLAQATDVID